MEQSGLPRPPFVAVSGLANARDIGGYPVATSAGKIVKPGLVFRASEPSKATDQDIAKLQDLNIRAVYDLRSAGEIEHDGTKVRQWPDVERIHAAIFPDQAHSPDALAARLKRYNSHPHGFVFGFQEDVLESASSMDNKSQPFKQILEHLASSPALPILIHDSAGKDRTGVVCALVLSLCGVPDEVVAHEYSLTDLGLRPSHPDFLNALIHDQSIKADPHTARRMNASRKETMLDFLAMIKKRWGSVESCVISHGFLDIDGIQGLQGNLIADGNAIDWQAHVELVAEAVRVADKLADTIECHDRG